MYVLEDICQGKHSPVLPVRVTGENGETFESRTRIAFIRRDDGQADVVFYPVLKSSPLEKYSEAQQKQLLDGKAVIVDVETSDGRHSKARTGIRFCHGDGEKWREQTRREWDKYTFGCYGCWVMDDDGNLNYVSEDDYTEEMWNEQKKSAERNRAAALHK